MSDPRLIPLASADDVWEGAILQASLPDGHKLALYNFEGRIYATDDVCTHGAASLSEDGSVDGPFVECGWHNGRFDLRTGAACAMPCMEALKSWPIQIVDGRVCVVWPAVEAAAA
jgi:p-cumate 2,3-dioxygenase ferredoxin subunit